MVNTRQFSGSTYMQDMTKKHIFSQKSGVDLYAEKYSMTFLSAEKLKYLHLHKLLPPSNITRVIRPVTVP